MSGDKDSEVLSYLQPDLFTTYDLIRLIQAVSNFFWRVV